MQSFGNQLITIHITQICMLPSYLAVCIFKAMSITFYTPNKRKNIYVWNVIESRSQIECSLKRSGKRACLSVSHQTERMRKTTTIETIKWCCLKRKERILNSKMRIIARKNPTENCSLNYNYRYFFYLNRLIRNSFKQTEKKIRRRKCTAFN